MSTTPAIPVILQPQPIVGAPVSAPTEPQTEEYMVVQCEPLRTRVVTAQIIARTRGEPSVTLPEGER